MQHIEPNGVLLMVDHKPLIPVFNGSGDYLPVKLSGVNVKGLGISWLQAIVAGTEIHFIPILKQKDWIECEVQLPQQTRDVSRHFYLISRLLSIIFLVFLRFSLVVKVSYILGFFCVNV